MKKEHFSEEQLQRHALTGSIMEETDHLSSYPECRFQVELYRTVHLGIQESTEPKLDLVIDSLILGRMHMHQLVGRSVWDSLYPFLFGTPLLLVMAIFAFWHTIVHILAGIDPSYLIFGLVFIVGYWHNAICRALSDCQTKIGCPKLTFKIAT